MTTDGAAADVSNDRPHECRATRVRRRVREIDPTWFVLLGLLAVPGFLVESLAFMQVFVLFFLWPFVEPVLDLALKRRADEETEPTDWIHMGDWREWVVAYLSMPLTFLNPLTLAQDGLQLLGSAVASVRHRGSVPAPEDDRSTAYRPPVAGTWTVVNGSLEKEYSHSWLPLTQRYAYDFVITDDDGRSRPEGTAPAVEAYYCYDEPVLAPADGVVVDVLDTDLEPSRGGGFSHPLKRDIRGNYVTIQHAPDEFSCLAHLVPGSVAVEPGERVERGQRVGRCGHSGSSSEPHLHVQFQEHPTFETAAGVPVRFEGVSVESPWLDDDGSAQAEADGEASEPAIAGSVPGPADESIEADGDGGVAITAGQRITVDEPPARTTDGGASLTADAAPGPATGDVPNAAADERDRTSTAAMGIGSGPRSRVVAGLELLAFGTIASGVLIVLATIAAGLAGVALGPLELAAVLAVAALAGLGWRFAVDGDERVARPGWFGAPLGFALVAALWAGLPSVRSPSTLLVVGVAAYVLIAEYDRRSLRRAFED